MDGSAIQNPENWGPPKLEKSNKTYNNQEKAGKRIKPDELPGHDADEWFLE